MEHPNGTPTCYFFNCRSFVTDYCHQKGPEISIFGFSTSSMKAHALLVTKIKGCNIGREKLRQDEGVLCGHIQDHKDGLKKCIVTQIYLHCGKITSGSQRTHLVTNASWSGLNFQGI